MKVIIFGSSGFVGRNLIENFPQELEIISADVVKPPFEGVNHKVVDITNLQNVEEAIAGCDIVINLAAHHLTKSFSEIHRTIEINLIGLVNILEAARKQDTKKVIFTSASSLLGNTINDYVKETDFPKPTTPYGAFKLTGEHLLNIYHDTYGLKFTVFRFFNIYGPYQKAGIIPAVYERLTSNKPIQVFGDGNQIRDYVFVPDVADFFLDSILKNVANNEQVNMGTGIGSTIMDVIKTASTIMNIEPNIQFQDPRPGEIANFVADTSHLQSVFGKVPKTPLKEGLEKTFNSYSTKN